MTKETRETVPMYVLDEDGNVTRTITVERGGPVFTEPITITVERITEDEEPRTITVEPTR